MPAVARIGDAFATGHPCDASSALGEGSDTVFANAVPVSRLGDLSATHTVLVGKDCVPHTAPIASGSASVFANGVPLARVGDSIDAGAITKGAPSVFAG